MNEVQLKDKTFVPYMSEDEILQCVKNVAAKINKDYAGKTPLFLGVLNGAFMFASDLMKELTIPCNISFVKFSSYDGTQSTGNVQELIGINEDITGRDIVIIEDIIESGHTMRQMLDSLARHNPASVSICVLFTKPDKLEEELTIDYIGKKISDAFIVGYGFDYDQLGRNLRGIYQLSNH